VNISIKSTLPDRTISVTLFWIDRNEVSVSRYRAALAAGLPHPGPTNVKSNHDPSNSESCSWDDLPNGFEDFSLSCIDWNSARAFCNFRGGDLPSEVQWELAASGGRAYKSRHPWGDDPPDCAFATFGHAFGSLPSGVARTSDE